MSRTAGAGFQPAPLVTLLGLVALASISVVDEGATRIFLTPWTVIRWTAVLAPWIALILRACDRRDPIRLPNGLWLAALGFGAAVGLASACLSPWPGFSLLWSTEPLSFFPWALLLFDWLGSREADRTAALIAIGAWTAAAFCSVSLVLWARDAVAIPRDAHFWQTLAETRNPHPLGHSNYTAGLCVLLLPWPWAAFWRGRGLPGLAWAGVGLGVLTVMVTSGSRAGLGGLAAEAVVMILLSRPSIGQLLLWCAAAAAVVAVLAVGNPRIRSLLLESDPQAAPNESKLQRDAMTHAGLAMGAARPVLGWGPGVTPLAFPRFRGGVYGGVEDALELHSAPIQLWAEGGALALLVALAIVALAARAAFVFPAATVTLGGYLVFSMADWQGDIPIFAFLVAATLAALMRPAPSPQVRVPFLVAMGSLIALALVCIGAKSDPTPALNARALSLGDGNETKATAISLLRESLARNPDQEIAAFNLGWLNIITNPVESQADFATAARLVPDKGGVYFGFALAAENQGRPTAVAIRALTLECLNDPAFITAPWWQLPQLKAIRPQVLAELDAELARVIPTLRPEQWPAAEAVYVRALFGWFAGRVSAAEVAAVARTAPQRAFFAYPDLPAVLAPGATIGYHRRRIGYPVLMRNEDIGAPADVYLVQEDPVWTRVHGYLFPSKGWLQTYTTLRLIDDPTHPKS